MSKLEELNSFISKQQTKAYCVKCQEEVTVKNSKKTKINGNEAIKGECPNCGTGVYKILEE